MRRLCESMINSPQISLGQTAEPGLHRLSPCPHGNRRTGGQGLRHEITADNLKKHRSNHFLLFDIDLQQNVCLSVFIVLKFHHIKDIFTGLF